MDPKTHTGLDPKLCGHPVELGEGFAVVELETLASMRADAYELVHGGFVFGLADHAAMLAINHPNVVLGRAAISFERPVVVGDRLSARAELQATEGKKQRVDVVVRRGDTVVMRGEFTCLTPDKHVLARGDER
jgi:acyl-coenzyme A thioesterase PaaI-like protein